VAQSTSLEIDVLIRQGGGLHFLSVTGSGIVLTCFHVQHFLTQFTRKANFCMLKAASSLICVVAFFAGLSLPLIVDLYFGLRLQESVNIWRLMFSAVVA